MLLYTESPELSLKVLSMELKTVTDPIQLGVGLGVPQHHLEIIRKNNLQSLCKVVNCTCSGVTRQGEGISRLLIKKLLPTPLLHIIICI